MYPWLVISFLVGACFAIYWKITQDRISGLEETVSRQGKVLDKNLADVREEYARVFREVRRKGSARELLDI